LSEHMACYIKTKTLPPYKEEQKMPRLQGKTHGSLALVDVRAANETPCDAKTKKVEATTENIAGTSVNSTNHDCKVITVASRKGGVGNVKQVIMLSKRYSPL